MRSNTERLRFSRKAEGRGLAAVNREKWFQNRSGAWRKWSGKEGKTQNKVVDHCFRQLNSILLGPLCEGLYAESISKSPTKGSGGECSPDCLHTSPGLPHGEEKLPHSSTGHTPKWGVDSPQKALGKWKSFPVQLRGGAVKPRKTRCSGND